MIKNQKSSINNSLTYISSKLNKFFSNYLIQEQQNQEPKYNQHKVQKKNERTTKTMSKIHLCPYGSYYLNFLTKESDIDVVIVFPIYSLNNILNYEFSHDEIFELVGKFIEKNKNEFKKSRIVMGATVPVCKFTYKNYKYDLSVVLYPVEKVSVDIHVYTNDAIESGRYYFDEKSYLSMRGCYDWFCLKKYIMKKTRVRFDVIKEFNQIIITWAKKRKIYSSVLGYFPGFTIRILNFYIIKKYGNKGFDKVEQFLYLWFNEFVNFDWSNEAIDLFDRHVDVYKRFYDNPKHSRFYHNPYVMFILTPGNKQTIRNMTRSTYYQILDEIHRGNEIISKARNKGRGLESIKDVLLGRKYFFIKEKDEPKIFFCVTVIRKKDSDFFGYTLSRLVRLAILFEQIDKNIKVLTYPHAFKLKECENEDIRYYFLSVTFLDINETDKKLPEFRDFRPKINEFVEDLKEWEQYEKGMTVLVREIMIQNIRKFQKIQDEE